MPKNPADLPQTITPSGLTPFWISGGGEVALYYGDVIDILGQLPERSVHCCITSPPYWGLRSYLDGDHDNKHQEIGGEDTPEEFVAKMVEVTRGVWRVLRDDGTFWLNLGDSYGGPPGGKSAKQQSNLGSFGCRRQSIPLASGNLVGIPWRVALALQADGWYLRCDLPWVKVNSMPESCDSRPSKSVENVFLLTKTNDYYFDMQAIRQKGKSIYRTSDFLPDSEKDKLSGTDSSAANASRSNRSTDPVSGRNFRSSDLWYSSVDKGAVGVGDELLGFDVPVANFKGAHFATFPQRLIEPMILAGTSEHGCCGKCGDPYRRVVEVVKQAVLAEPDVDGRDRSIPSNRSGITGSLEGVFAVKETVGWTVGCSCNADVVRCTVLDPFNGSGTTCATAVLHGRHGVGIDLSDIYLRDCAVPRIEAALLGEKKTVVKKQVLNMRAVYCSPPPVRVPRRT